MAKEIGYSAGGGCGSTIVFGLDDDGMIYAELGGDYCYDEDLLATFAEDCGVTLDEIRADLTKKRRKPKK